MLNIFGYEYLRTRNRVLSIRTKLLIGMALASLTMFLAGIFEIVRQKYCRTGQTSLSYRHFLLSIDLAFLGLDRSDLSLYMQLPQYICMGLSEVFGTITTLEFAYLAAPRSGQSLFMSLQFCSVGISSFLSSGYLAIYPTASGHFDFSVRTRSLFLPVSLRFEIFQCSNNDQWTFTTYFFILAFLQLAFMFITYLCDRRFNLFKINQQQQQQLASPAFQENSSNASTA